MKFRIIFSLLLIQLTFGLNGQQPQAIAYKTYGRITIDGIANEKDWAMATINSIDSIYIGEEASITGNADLSGYWKALYSDRGLYLFISVIDDYHYISADYGQTWEKDQVEIYFDMNTGNLKDGHGGQDFYNGIVGHYQISGNADSASSKTSLPSFVTQHNGDRQYLVRSDGSYTEELYIPWKAIPALGDTVFMPDTKTVFGIDFYLIDNDGPNHGAARSRKVWANKGWITEDWSNMDDAGILLCKPDSTTVIITKLKKDTITVDGIINETIWNSAVQNNIAKNFGSETFDNNLDLSAYWKALYNDSGIYVLVNVFKDDVHYTSGTYGQAWEKDKIEVYFDMNTDDLKDGKGPNDGAIYDGRNMGHYVIAPLAEPNQTLPGWCERCQLQTSVNADNSYITEMYVPWETIKSVTNSVFIPDSMKRFGFDVTIADNDGPGKGAARNRKVWMNKVEPESFNNMDGCGSISCLVPKKPTQSIKFGPLYERTYGDGPFKINAKASSGLPLTFLSSDTTVARIKADSVFIISPGYTNIIVSQAGNDTLPPVKKYQTLVVNKAELTVAAMDATRNAGQSNPAFTLIYEGFINSENENVLNSQPKVTCTANISSAPGIYNIIVSGGSAKNYDFKYINGKLTVLLVLGLKNIINSDIKYHPNPVHNFFKVSNIQSNKASLLVYNLQGKMIFSLPVSNNTPIDISQLSPGLYFIKLLDGDKMIMDKLIKR